MPDPFIGEIIIFGGNFAPRGWAFCEGQLIAISSNQALFSILGTTYGGDGRTTFALPDLRGRAPLQQGHGPGLSNYQLGQKGGVEQVTLTEAQMPSHQHGVECDNGAGDGFSPPNKLPAGAADRDNIYGDPVQPTQLMNAGMITATGGGGAHTNIEPYLAINYIIALVGVYPSRN